MLPPARQFLQPQSTLRAATSIQLSRLPQPRSLAKSICSPTSCRPASTPRPLTPQTAPRFWLQRLHPTRLTPATSIIRALAQRQIPFRRSITCLRILRVQVLVRQISVPSSASQAESADPTSPLSQPNPLTGPSLSTTPAPVPAELQQAAAVASSARQSTSTSTLTITSGLPTRRPVRATSPRSLEPAYP